ncbi:bifunctional diaminohydroxyphosphoribosylaminopyrimidine deaminase/5-amino-6-(5-phosphoribosylamino)uracil reductase RibD [Subtercola boreus]|uniref:Riboflavin biosynthesis protein RibD n=1 Tax=Subtercola boreus TaxID=120213 RepID=A0A3E0WCN8_9MICO|nr:bifunctional diaminohydroxyphosphoribosylaminopyrimidine deaminase/5-amino-6-(5-phosphoribosylamino)uracil reductase RibD [Subtercola boreus]RFA22581.1 riboflavin biosynthesis protein RibD [Subtercola boreus]RFA22937.1 riboflavin biosynthesis protein RibD [Subtercola boreus]RFA28688.1 riboflavin biosynthesis protein RibD [Subtercola boreus]
MHAASEKAAEAVQAVQIAAAMARAVELSQNGPAWGVNPQVGCVILGPDGSILAEGWHRGSGTPHAEQDALSRLASPALARGATVVVTLEPCNHRGRTGPCSEALVAAGVGEVYFGVDDPGVESAGGARRLDAAGVPVQGGIAANDVEQSIRPWLTAVRAGRPHVTLKWASSLDGRAAAADGSSRWITGPDARLDVHARRSRVDAIVVGTGTVLTDDPALTARGADGDPFAHQPVPVVIGLRGAPLDRAVWQHPERVREYRTHDVAAVLADLFAAGVRSVYVEGGPTLASAFIEADLVDELVVYLAPALLGGPILALGDLGVASIGEARRLSITSIDLLDADVRIVAHPAPVRVPPTIATTMKETDSVHRNH